MPHLTQVSVGLGDDALLYEGEAFAQDCVEDSVLDEPGDFPFNHSLVPERLNDPDQRLADTVIGPLTGHDLDHGDQVRRIRPVHADHPAGVLQVLSDFRDENPGCVGGQDGICRRMLLETGEDLPLHLKFLRHRLQDQVRA